MAAAHANFSPLRVRNTVKNFTKRSMEISPTWSSHFPAHSKHEKNSLYTLVKFQEERYRCTESKLWVILQESKRSTVLLFWTFLHLAPILLESIEPWVIGEKREVKTFKTKKMSDKREIWMREYDKKVVLFESQIRHASNVGRKCVGWGSEGWVIVQTD